VLGERVTRHYDVLVVQGAFVRRDERPIVAEDAEQNQSHGTWVDHRSGL